MTSDSEHTDLATAMVDGGDDFLIHQTPELLRYVATSDRRFYDRHWISGHSSSDELYLMFGLGSYPNLGVLDAFASVAINGEQHTVRGSRELGNNRFDTTRVGPIDLTILEPGRSFRIECRPHSGEVEFDLEWEAATPLFAEPGHFERSVGRIIQEGSRLVQTGKWSGSLQVRGTSYEVTPDRWWGARDRAWGVRSIGLEREPRGILQAKQQQNKRAALWIWAPMQFEDHTVHFTLGETSDGRRTGNAAREVRFSGIRELEQLEHDLEFDPDTRDFIRGSVSWKDPNGERTTVKVEPLTQGWMRAGTGYGGPDPWRHGKYMGENWSDVVSFDVSEKGDRSRLGPAHVVCRFETSRGEVGYGLFETQVYGRYDRYGFGQ
ncbi:hypothetical protein ACH47B_36765 [Rhodococcus sp. NPDC019627]|uniref:hypothetical protein n=1 Tax=unclassified Rhodococcus (in: high G+C Gram-positive bacteria) TaxID=192944 RepID=UPI0033D5DE12